LEAADQTQISASRGNDKPVIEKLHSWFRSTPSLPDKAMALVHAKPAVRLGRYKVWRYGSELVRGGPERGGVSSEESRRGSDKREATQRPTQCPCPAGTAHWRWYPAAGDKKSGSPSSGLPCNRHRQIRRKDPLKPRTSTASMVRRQAVKDRSDGTSSDARATALAALLNLASKPALEDIFDAHFQVRPEVVTNLRLG